MTCARTRKRSPDSHQIVEYDRKHKDLPGIRQVSIYCRRNIYHWLLVIIMPLVRTIITLIVLVVVISVGVATIIIGLTLIVIAVGIIAVGIIAVGIPWPYGNGNLSFRFRRNQSDKSNDG